MRHYVHRKDDGPLAFAGLWESWRGETQTIESCTIITTEANALMAELHHRMPVMLDPQDFDWWMTGKTEEVGQLLTPCPSDWLEAYAISRRVNNTRNDDADLLKPAA